MISLYPAMANEKNVLKELEKVKAALDSDMSYSELQPLLSNARAEINIAKRGKFNSCFLSAVENCHEFYRKAIEGVRIIRIMSLSLSVSESEISRMREKYHELGASDKKINEALSEVEKNHEKCKQDREKTKMEFLANRKIAETQLDKAYDCLK